MKKILFFNINNEQLPEILIYKNYFGKHGFICEYSHNISESQHSEYPIHWYIMGTDISFPFKSKPKILIHEYQSASIGNMSALKDMVKKTRFISRKPDLRIFQSRSINEHYAFSDNVPFIYRDMGYTPEINSIKGSKSRKDIDFLYIGSLDKKRNLNVFIDAFLQEKSSKKLHLLGKTKDSLLSKYARSERIVFHGSVPHGEVKGYIARSKVCVNYIPDKFPFNIQTSTKLIEYAAYGDRFISTDYQWIKDFERQTGFFCYKFKCDMTNFNIEEALSEKFIKGNIEEYNWNKILEKSKILVSLEELLNNDA